MSERERVRERKGEREREPLREKKREREREREREEKRREERNEDRRKSKGGIFRVRSTSMRATFFTSQNLNVLLQPFVAVEFERTKKNPERTRKKSLRKSLYPPYENRLFTSTPVLPVALLTPCVVAPREKSGRRARMEQRSFVLIAQNRALISSSRHQLQSLSSAKRNQNSEKLTRHACALFFDAAEPVGDSNMQR